MKSGENCSCEAGENYQKISKKFIKNVSIDKLKLSKELLDKPVYFYIVATVKEVENKFVQTGSGPNFEGNYITLTTCKHYMRTFPNVDKEVWIAGITSKNISDKKQNYLFYLALIKQTFSDQYGISAFLKKQEPETYKAKLVTTNRLGDIFSAKHKLNDKEKLEPFNYKEPIEGHSHVDSWRHDIIKQYKNLSKTILFDPKNSFVWTERKIKVETNLKDGQRRKETLNEFIQMLE